MADPPADFVAGMDQFGAMAKTVAQVVAQYYKGLVDSGIPKPVAVSLTQDFANLQWRKALGFAE